MVHRWIVLYFFLSCQTPLSPPSPMYLLLFPINFPSWGLSLTVTINYSRPTSSSVLILPEYPQDWSCQNVLHNRIMFLKWCIPTPLPSLTPKYNSPMGGLLPSSIRLYISFIYCQLEGNRVVESTSIRPMYGGTNHTSGPNRSKYCTMSWRKFSRSVCPLPNIPVSVLTIPTSSSPSIGWPPLLDIRQWYIL